LDAKLAKNNAATIIVDETFKAKLDYVNTVIKDEADISASHDSKIPSGKSEEQIEYDDDFSSISDFSSNAVLNQNESISVPPLEESNHNEATLTDKQLHITKETILRANLESLTGPPDCITDAAVIIEDNIQLKNTTDSILKNAHILENEIPNKYQNTEKSVIQKDIIFGNNNLEILDQISDWLYGQMISEIATDPEVLKYIEPCAKSKKLTLIIAPQLNGNVLELDHHLFSAVTDIMEPEAKTLSYVQQIELGTMNVLQGLRMYLDNSEKVSFTEPFDPLDSFEDSPTEITMDNQNLLLGALTEAIQSCFRKTHLSKNPFFKHRALSKQEILTNCTSFLCKWKDYESLNGSDINQMLVEVVKNVGMEYCDGDLVESEILKEIHEMIWDDLLHDTTIALGSVYNK
jgi:hypothetical protein